MSETDVVMMMKWGTWEELLLGGAVLRHGTHAWDAVAAEIRSRTLYPFFFTPEVCKAKYEELREHYCGCNAWFEELRKRRVAELKRELEKSDDSIGSLETKLESLKGEKNEEEDDCNVKYDDSNRTESPVSDGSTERIEFPGKETSNFKDGLSAGSFTEEIHTTWSPEPNQIQATDSTQETEIIGKETSNFKDGLSAGSFTEEIHTTWSPEQNQIQATDSIQETEIIGKDTSNLKDGLSASSFTEEIHTTWSPEQNQIQATDSIQETEIIKSEEEIDEKKTCLEIFGGNLRKRRGKRKRKDCSSNNNQINHQVKEVKEGSVGDSDVFRKAADLDTGERDCDDDEPMAMDDDREKVDLIEILNLFIENEKENAAVFRCRLDSQKRARYKKTIRCHMDFHRVRSRINDRSITTDRELFRDLLLLSNNALVFYPKTSPEFAAAMSLRELAVKTFRQERSVSTRDSGVDGSCGRNDDGAAVVVIESQACNPPPHPVKLPRSVRPRNRKVVRKVVNSCTEETPDQKVEITKKTPDQKIELTKKTTDQKVEMTKKTPDEKVEITKKEPCEIEEEIPLVDSLPLVASKKVRVRAGKIGGRSGPKRAETSSPVKGKKKARRR